MKNLEYYIVGVGTTLMTIFHHTTWSFLAMLCTRGSGAVPGSQETVYKIRYPHIVNDGDETRFESMRNASLPQLDSTQMQF